MADSYTLLANIYPYLNSENYAELMTPRLINFILQDGWLGRNIIDLGCGTGVSLQWLAKQGYVTQGFDASASMLQKAEDRLQSAGIGSVNLKEADITQMTDLPHCDLALCLNVLNELSGLNEFQAVINNVYQMLGTDKYFVFDLWTIQGLFTSFNDGDRMLVNNEKLAVFTQNEFDFERQIQNRTYTVFKLDKDVWKRYETPYVLRAYPIQAIVSILKRMKFDVRHVLTTRLSPYIPEGQQDSRVIFIAQKR